MPHRAASPVSPRAPLLAGLCAIAPSIATFDPPTKPPRKPCLQVLSEPWGQHHPQTWQFLWALVADTMLSRKTSYLLAGLAPWVFG